MSGIGPRLSRIVGGTRRAWLVEFEGCRCPRRRGHGEEQVQYLEVGCCRARSPRGLSCGQHGWRQWEMEAWVADGRHSEQSWAAARVCLPPALAEPPRQTCSLALLAGGSLDAAAVVVVAVADGGVVAEEVVVGGWETEAGVVLGMPQHVVVVVRG